MFDYDPDDEQKKLVRLLKVLIFFLIFFCFTVSDLNYLFRAESTDTAVIDVSEGRSADTVTIEFTYQDPDGTPRRARDSVGVSLTGEIGQTIPIEFFPGDEDSAEYARPRYWSLVILLAGLAVVGVMLWPVFREARDTAHGVRPGRGRRRR